MRTGHHFQRAFPPKDSKAHHKRRNGIKIPHNEMSAVRAAESFVQHRSGWWGPAEPSLAAGYTHSAPAAKAESVTSEGKAQSITFVSGCKLHQDRVYSCLYSTQHVGLGCWQDRGRAGTISTLLGIRGWEGTQKSCPSDHPLLTEQGPRAELRTGILVPTSHAFQQTLGT